MILNNRNGFNSLSGPALDDHSFQTISKFAYEKAGLAIAPSKAAMVRTRLARRLRHLGLDSFEAYCNYVQSDQGEPEQVQLISALTTNVSHFFREKHHFEQLTNQVLPQLSERVDKGQPVRIWSAGCSNGQEPYSIAISLFENGLVKPGKDIKILASDIDPEVVAFARKGEYPSRMLDNLDTSLRTAYFAQTPADMSGTHWKVKKNIQNLISFRKLNLLDTWPMKGQFDVIFCRNVVIYFDQKTQDRLWEKFTRILRPGGWLFLGHSERVSDKYQDQFELLGGTAYRCCKN